MFESDGDLEKRLIFARDKARKLMRGQYDNYEESILLLQFAIASHWGIPLFSDYFENRTFEELVFEHELIKISKETPEEKSKNIVAENIDEVGAIFDEWDEPAPQSAPKKWVDTTPSGHVMSEEEVAEEERKFMQTGQFKEP